VKNVVRILMGVALKPIDCFKEYNNFYNIN
jgi:hypothetical protein